MWTKEAPKKPGFYWFKWPNGGREVFEATEWGPFSLTFRRIAHSTPLDINRFPIGEFWSEPITPPE